MFFSLVKIQCFKGGSFVPTARDKLIKMSWALTATRFGEIRKSFLVINIVKNWNRLSEGV